MRKRSPRVGRTARVTTVTVVTVGLVAFAVAASAASLGGINVGSIFTQTTPVTIVIPDPDPIVYTDFSGCSNTLDGWVDDSGATWTSHSGDWQCLGSGVVRARRREDLANATVQVPQWSGEPITVSTHIADISHQNNRSGPGLALFGDGAGGLVYVMYERDSDRVVVGYDYPSGSDSVTFAYPGDVESATMSVDIDGSILDITFDGQYVGSYTVPSNVLGNKRFGLVADNDNQSRFDSFTIAALP